MGDYIDHHRSPNAKEHTNQTSCHADQDRLNQELRQDVDAFRTNTHTQTDLTGTLRHADIHDIHDTDTADQQRDTRHSSQQGGHDVGRGSQHRAQFLHTTNGKVILVRIFQAVVATQDLRDLLDRLFRVLLIQS